VILQGKGARKKETESEKDNAKQGVLQVRGDLWLEGFLGGLVKSLKNTDN